MVNSGVTVERMTRNTASARLVRTPSSVGHLTGIQPQSRCALCLVPLTGSRRWPDDRLLRCAALCKMWIGPYSQVHRTISWLAAQGSDAVTTLTKSSCLTLCILAVPKGH
jgi:hypothetical protein